MSEEKKELKELQLDLMKVNERAEANLDGWKRAKADYLNLVKEQEKKTEELMAWANATFMSEVLPIYNHFKLALAHIPWPWACYRLRLLKHWSSCF
jgi:molecular chaperone GrpE (heat shock protein)